MFERFLETEKVRLRVTDVNLPPKPKARKRCETTFDNINPALPLKDPKLWELYGIFLIIMGNAGFISSTVGHFRVSKSLGLHGKQET